MNGSVYCDHCKGDLAKGTCTCGHELCRECVGCVTCNFHWKRCPNRKD